VDGARVYWFVTNTTLHGRSTGTPEFSFTDPDTNLTPPGAGDACPPPIIGLSGLTSDQARPSAMAALVPAPASLGRTVCCPRYI